MIDKFVPKSLKIVVNLVLWVIIIALGYFTFMSVYGEIQFNQLKEKRYAVVIEKLIDIRDAELAYKQVNGKFTDSFDELVKFIDNGEFTIVQKRDTTVKDEEMTRRFGVDMTKEVVLVDTLGTRRVKDSLFGADTRYKNMMDVPGGQPGAKFKLEAGTLDDIPVFMASVDKAVILHDQDKNLIEKEEQVVSVDGVNGPTLMVGSMTEIKTKGNWPISYSKEQ
ncbi:MAG: hypothetical protein ACSHXF_13780 [Aquaticitalea sp.]